VRLLPCGDTGLLVELADLDAVLALHAALAAALPAGVVDLVPAARTVLLRLDPARTTVEQVAAAVRTARPRPHLSEQAALVEVPVTYDGADLDEVGTLTGLGRDGVVAAHTGADLDGGLRRLRPRLRLPGRRGRAAARAAAEHAAHARACRRGRAGRRVQRRLPARVAGRVAAARAHRPRAVGPRPRPARAARPRMRVRFVEVG
jgi:hypothetical protein